MALILHCSVVAQLYYTLIISSFNTKPTFRNRCITLKASGTKCFPLRVSPIKMAQNLSGFRTRSSSLAIFSISSQNFGRLDMFERSNGILPSEYFIMFIYGGWVKTKSKESSLKEGLSRLYYVYMLSPPR